MVFIFYALHILSIFKIALWPHKNVSAGTLFNTVIKWRPVFSFTFLALENSFQLVVSLLYDRILYIHIHCALKCDSIFRTTHSRFSDFLEGIAQMCLPTFALFKFEILWIFTEPSEKLFQIGPRSPMYWICPMPIPIPILVVIATIPILYLS